MSQTNIATGDSVTNKVFSAALFATTQRQPTLMKNMTGAAPQQSAAEAKLKGQSSHDYPIVRVTDLSSSAGDKVSVDMINIIGGKPIMGDKNAEGKGEKLSFSTMEVKIDLATKVVDAGATMSQKRTKHNLRKLALAQLAGYMPRLESQSCLTHMAGARGFQSGLDWVVPLASDADFSDIMINSVKAPTYNRHYVANGTTLDQGGVNVTDGTIATTDDFKLEHVDFLRTLIDDAELKIQPIKLADDPASEDEPLYLLLVSARQWNSIFTNTSNTVWKTMLQNAWTRKSYGSKHPLFNGEPGLWNNILIKKSDRAIRFNEGDAYRYVAAADRYTATETAGTVNFTGTVTTHAIDRALLLGAQALCNVYGKNQSSDYYYGWSENWYNFKRNLEVAGEMMGGKAKVRFDVPDGLGNVEPTDHGIYALDTVVKL